MTSISELRMITGAEYSFIAEIGYDELELFNTVLSQIKEQHPQIYTREYPHVGGSCTYMLFVRTVDDPQAIYDMVRHGMERD